MKTATARFRDLSAIPAEGPWIHIVPKGEFPGTIDIPEGYDVPGYGRVSQDTQVEGITVLADDNIERIVQGFEPDILIDYEHFSHDRDKATEAAGWGKNLRHTAARDGLELETGWTAPAREKITGGVYRHISPEFSGHVRHEDGTFKFFPTALTGAGLTNRPKIKALRPVSANRDTPPPTMNYKQMLCKLLGLPDTATDEEITAKIQPAESELAASQNRATEINTLKAELKTLKDAAIEADLERFADVIDDKESARQLLQLNRDTTIKVLASAQAKKSGAKPATVTPIHQHNRATAPDGAKFREPDTASDAATAKFRAVEAKANQIVAERRIPFTAAFELAKAELGA